MAIRKTYGFISLALIGAIIATLCDANHVYTQTLSYPAPVFAGQAWWVFPGFFLAFLLMIACYVWLAKRSEALIETSSSQTAGSATAMMESMVTFMMIYLLSGFGNESPKLLALIFYATFILRWAVTYEKPWVLMLAALMGAGGMFVEGLLSLFGQVSYRHVDVFGVPLWLGALYMHGAMALREGVRFFVYR